MRPLDGQAGVSALWAMRANFNIQWNLATLHHAAVCLSMGVQIVEPCHSGGWMSSKIAKIRQNRARRRSNEGESGREYAPSTVTRSGPEDQRIGKFPPAIASVAPGPDSRHPASEKRMRDRCPGSWRENGRVTHFRYPAKPDQMALARRPREGMEKEHRKLERRANWR